MESPVVNVSNGTVDVTCLCVSPDGQTVLCGTRDGSLTAYSVSNRSKQWEIKKAHVKYCAWTHSAKGDIIISSGLLDSRVKGWNAHTREMIWKIQAKSMIWNCAMSPNGQWAVYSDGSRDTVIFDVVSGSAIAIHTLKGITAACMSISYDGSWWIAGCRDGSIMKFQNMKDKKPITLKGHTDYVWCCSISPDGTYFITGSEDKTLIMWDAHTNQIIRHFIGHTDKVLCCSISPNGKWILSGSEDETLRVWNVTDGTLIQELKQHTKKVRCCAILGNGDSIVSGGEDNKLIFTTGSWNAACKNTEKPVAPMLPNVTPSGNQNEEEHKPSKKPKVENAPSVTPTLSPATPSSRVTLFSASDNTDVKLPPLIFWLDHTPLCGIDECLADLKQEFPRLGIYFGSVKKAVPTTIHTNLTMDERTAIYIYTMELPPLPDGTNGSVYYRLNQLLRSQDRTALKPYFKYLKLLLSGLYKLPPYSSRVCRGIKGNIYDDMKARQKAKAEIIWYGFSSTTANSDVLEKDTFLGKSGERAIFFVHCKNGRNIQALSAIPTEDEILILPCSSFKVEHTIRHGELTMVDLTEAEAYEDFTPLFQ